MAETKSIHEKRFEAAVNVIQSLPKNGSFQPSNEMMLKFYSYYKQATQGPCNIPRPGFWDPIGRYKWDAWSGLGDMSKEDAMIAYVEEMKKIIETMPMTEKVEELLHVLGPFYEIVEDKRLNKIVNIASDLGNVLTSTPNCKKVNGKADSSDSGAESEEEEDEDDQEEEDEAEQEEKDETSVKNLKNMMHDSAVDLKPDGMLTNGPSEEKHGLCTVNGIQDKLPVNDEKQAEELHKTENSIMLPEISKVNGYLEPNEDHCEEISSPQHLTSDSDSEVFCDSMEQFGQEESSEVLSSGRALLNHSGEMPAVHPDKLLENVNFKQVNSQKSSVSAVEMAPGVEGEVKHGGEDGKPSGSGPHKEKMSSERTEFPGPRRGRGSRTQPLGDGAHGGQLGIGGSGGDGERWGTERGPKSSLSEQIAVALMRLQEDMHSVLQRLHTLEVLTASQTRSVCFQPNNPAASSANKV
nr:PREDICTED: acyl-CoA-binding domain-containing protein 5 [Latimeria chalumnae]|eukprot:XP_014349528.1 PREDICTED: acyl-CoA-binding domain-containing protein 5 [Latimeria chalumnae]